MNTTASECEFVTEVEAAAAEVRAKAAKAGWDRPISSAYAQTSLELLRIVRRHVDRCPLCLVLESPAYRRGMPAVTISKPPEPVSASTPRELAIKHVLQSGGLYSLASFAERKGTSQLPEVQPSATLEVLQ